MIRITNDQRLINRSTVFGVPKFFQKRGKLSQQLNPVIAAPTYDAYFRRRTILSQLTLGRMRSILK
jgi:hypothetical protein